MGVGKYNLPAMPEGFQGGALDLSGPAFSYTQPGGPPAGLSANPFDQTSINWGMAQKYGRERAQENQNIQKLYDQAYTNWQLNGQRGPAPNQPALYETDPNKLYTYFNSSQPGILLQNGVVSDNRSSLGKVDPLQYMFNQGTANPAGPARVAPPAKAAPPAAPAPAAPPAAAQTPPAWDANLTPAQREANIRNLSGGPQFPNTGLQDFGAGLTPAQRTPQGPLPASAAPPGTPSPAPSPATEIVTGQDPGSIGASTGAGSTPAPGAAAGGLVPPPGMPNEWFQFIQQYLRQLPGYRASGYEYQPNAGAPAPFAGAPPPAGAGRAATSPTGQRGTEPTPYVAPAGNPQENAPAPQFNMRPRGSSWNNRRGY